MDKNIVPDNKDEIKAKVRKNYITTIIVGVVMFVCIMAIRGGFSPESTVALILALTDSTFVTGVLLLGSGLLVWSSKEGTFDMISYSGVLLYKLVSPKYKKEKGDYYEYRKKRHEKKRTFMHLIVVGGGFIAVSIVFWVIYNNM